MLVTKTQFLRYQNAFYKKLQSVPYKVQLEVTTVKESEPTEEFSMDSFVGDSQRTSVLYEFRTLYEKEVSNRMREKYGLPHEVSGVVYFSPRQLIPKLGDYHLDWNRTKVHFEGRTQVIDRIVYLEEFKEYNTCIGIQIFVKDDLKGG